MDTLSASDGGVQPAGFDEEPFDIRMNARFGYPLPRLAGGSGEGEGGAGGEDSGDGDSFDAGEGQGSGLYDLSSAPEELRPYLEEQLKTVSKNVDARFREAADHRTKWSPYEELGIADVPAEELQELLSFRELLSDEDGFKSWLQAAAEQVGLDMGAAPEMDQDAWFAYGEEKGFLNGEEEPAEQPQANDQESLIQAVMAQMQEQLAPINDFMAAQQQEKAVDGELQQANATLEALREEHGEFDEPAVLNLAHAFLADPNVDPIQAAFAEWQRIRGEGESDLFDEKSDQPTGATLSGGVVDTSPPKFNGLSDPALKDAARARFAASS